MKKILLLISVWLVAMCAHAQADIISSTPAGTLYPTVYGSSEKTYLLAQGGFGSFSNNDGYCSSIVLDGDDMYVHNVIREFPGIDSWIKGRFVASDVVEFEFPQPVAVDRNTGDTLYVAMMKLVVKEAMLALVPDTESPCLRLRCNEARDIFTQIMPEEDEDALGNYAGMIGLVNGEGEFRSYGEQNVSYALWNKVPESPVAGLKTVDYTAEYTDKWHDVSKRLVKVGFDGDCAWIGGLCEAVPDAWLKGTVKEDGGIVLDSYQYLGVANDYLYFMCAVSGAPSVEAPFSPSVELKPVAGGYEADGPMVFNLGYSHVFLGVEVDGLKLAAVADSAPVPVNPEFGEPEWDENDGMGVADVLILPEDINGQALDPENLYYRVFFNGEPAALEYDEEGNPVTELKYGKESDLVLFMYDWHFIIFFEPLQSIGVQSVYKVDGKEYCSDVVTYEFPRSSVSTMPGSDADVVSVSYWSIDGTRIDSPRGLCIRKTVYSDGTVATAKLEVR